jgi:hypothetical protein
MASNPSSRNPGQTGSAGQAGGASESGRSSGGKGQGQEQPRGAQGSPSQGSGNRPPNSTSNLGETGNAEAGKPENLAAKVQEKTKEVTEKAVSSAQSTFQNTRSQVRDQIRTFAQAVHKAGDHLRDQQQMGMSNRLDQFGQKIDHAADYVMHKSPRDLLDDLGHLALRRPAWVLGGAFLAGMFGARFLKSSARKDPQQSFGGGRSKALPAMQGAGQRNAWEGESYGTS